MAATSTSNRARQHGFTLIELVVVVAVIAIVTVAVAAGVGNIRGASVQSETGKIAIAVRYLYNLSVLSGKNHRLVLDLDTQSYWAEAQTTSDPCETFLLPGEGEEEEAAKAAKRPGGKKKGKDEAAEKSNTAGFTPIESRLLAKTALDKGIKFGSVMTSHQLQPTEKGQAYVYFFPNGTTENAFIYVQGDEDDVMTVEVKALQGTATVHKQKVDVEKLGKQE